VQFSIEGASWIPRRGKIALGRVDGVLHVRRQHAVFVPLGYLEMVLAFLIAGFSAPSVGGNAAIGNLVSPLEVGAYECALNGFISSQRQCVVSGVFRAGQVDGIRGYGD